MALGGGTFEVQNKVLPGAYINFVSMSAATASLSDRGVVAIPVELDWGEAGKVQEITQEDFQKETVKLFGHFYTDDALRPMRELFCHAQKAYIYRLNGSEGVAATCSLATAKYVGTAGNNLKIVIEANVDDTSSFDVITYFGSTVVDRQTVTSADDLTDNDYVKFSIDSSSLKATAGTPLTGGTNGSVSGTAYSDALDAFESYSFNILACPATDETTKKLFVSYTKRLRDKVGQKFQLVLHQYAADYMGVISVENTVSDAGAPASALVYWTAGAEAACKIGESLMNTEYDGEYTVDVPAKQSELEAAIKAGKLIMHNVNGTTKILEDINTMVTTTDTQGDVFKDNQTIRVCDQIGNDIAALYGERYLGKYHGDQDDYDALKSDIVKHHQQLQQAKAIKDFDADDITVTAGETKDSVAVTDAIVIDMVMGKLYMTTVVA